MPRLTLLAAVSGVPSTTSGWDTTMLFPRALLHLAHLLICRSCPPEFPGEGAARRLPSRLTTSVLSPAQRSEQPEMGCPVRWTTSLTQAETLIVLFP